MVSMKSSSLNHYGPVTALKFEENLLLAGYGPFIKVYDISKRVEVTQKRIFKKNKIHGICIAEDQTVAVWGARSFAFFPLKALHDESIPIEELAVNDWIVSCEWNDECLYALTAHNVVHVIDKQSRKVTSSRSCGEKSILYSGSIKVTKNRTIVCAGTVMSGAVIWDLETGKILQTLTGHEGSIFGVQASNTGEKILTCSDDRTIKLWNLESGALEATGWGHGARIWQLAFFSNDCKIFSCSEDCTSRVWQVDGDELKCIQIFEPHLGKHVWCGEVNDALSIAATGGADGRVRILDLSPESRENSFLREFSPESFFDSSSQVRASNEIFKGYVDIGVGLVGITSHGKVFVLKGFNEWRYLRTIDRLANFSLANRFLLEDRAAVFSNKSGESFIFRFDSECEIIEEIVLEEEAFKAKVTGLITASSQNHRFMLLESSNPNDELILKVFSPSLQLIRSHRLSKPEEFQFVATCMVFDEVNEWLFVGSRFTKFTVYDLKGDDLSPLNTWKLHSVKDTVTSLSLVSSSDNQATLLMTNRDGFYMYLQVSGDDFGLKVIGQNRIQRGFLEGGFLNKDGDLILYGFKSSLFYCWNETKQSEVFNELCGGSHRTWIFTETQDSYRFIYTKASNVTVRQDALQPGGILNNGTHGREVRDVAVSPDFWPDSVVEKLIVTGSEDTTVRVSSLNLSSGVIQPFWSLRKHVSGLQSVKFLNERFFMTSAAREEFYLWEITEMLGRPYVSCLASLTPSQTNPDLRIMDFDSVEVTDEISNKTIGFIVAAVYSNSTIKVWHLDLEQGFVPIAEGSYTTCCLLKVSFLSFFSSEHPKLQLLTAATDGHMSVWDMGFLLKHCSINDNGSVCLTIPITGVQKMEHPLASQQVHQSGIKAIGFYPTSDDSYEIISGGDDNALVVSELQSDGAFMPLAFNSNAAASTITAISVIKDRATPTFLVTSVDQIWRVWSFTEEELILENSSYTTVADTGCCDVTVDKDNNSLVIIGGAGISTWEIESI